MGLFLGIDTSCYTTSLAVMDDRGILLAEQRQVLQVKQGTTGLRQSEAVWQHLCNLPLLLERLLADLPAKRLQRDLQVIVVSERPRPLADSYMPVFTAGLSFAQILAAAWSVPLLRTSHQEGHILAALWSAEPAAPKELSRFLAVHLSGGTTELLLVEKAKSAAINTAEGNSGKTEHLANQALSAEQNTRLAGEQQIVRPIYKISKLGGSIDIPAGQLIDRVGVKMGLAFPAGAALEQLARQCGRAAGTDQSSGRCEADGSIKTAALVDKDSAGVLAEQQQQVISSVVRGYEINFSGAENQAARLLAQGAAPALVARQVEACIAKALEKVLRRAVEEYQIKDILLAGGVAANGYLRERLCRQLQHRAVGARLIFAKPCYSTDNAAGTALAGRELVKSK